jgi:hypothetical protein
LWRWCIRAAGDTGIYPYLDNQALADLIAGKFPAPGRTAQPTDLRGVHFGVWGRAPLDREAALDSLRREIPAAGVEDILIGGTSWGLVESKCPTRVPS